jgi:hypothetical protein
MLWSRSTLCTLSGRIKSGAEKDLKEVAEQHLLPCATNHSGRDCLQALEDINHLPFAFKDLPYVLYEIFLRLRRVSLEPGIRKKPKLILQTIYMSFMSCQHLLFGGHCDLF